MRFISRIFVGMLFAAALAFGQSKSGPFTINASTSPCATIVTTANATVGIYVAGTFSATLQPEVALTGRDGSTGTPQNTQVTPSTSTTAASTITATGIYTAKVAGADTFLLCVTSYASGTATIYLNATTAVSILIPPAAAAGVTSVFTRTGAVTAQSGDYTVGQVTGAAPLTSPTFTGVPAAPTPVTNINTTQIPTTAWVNSFFAPLASPTFTGTVTLPTATLLCCGTQVFLQASHPGAGAQLVITDGGNSGENNCGDCITMGLWTSSTQTYGLNFFGGNGTFLTLDCTDALNCASTGTGIGAVLSAFTGGSIQLEINGASALTVNSSSQTAITNLSKPSKIASQTTAGTFGVPVVVGSSTLTGRVTALGTTTVYTAGAATETLAVHAIVNCDTTVSTATATLTIVYTDSSNTAITTTGTGALCTTLGTAAQQSINLPLIRAKNATVVSWAIAIANSPNFDASIQIERYQ